MRLYLFLLLTFPLFACSQFLGNDTTICAGESLNLAAPSGYNSYSWSTGENTNSITVSDSGSYFVSAYNTTGPNLVLNGDFEGGTTNTANNFITDYIPGTGGSWGLLSDPGQYAISTSPNLVHNNFVMCGDHTTGFGNMFIANGASFGNTSVWSQTVNVTPNTNYVFSLWQTSVETTTVPAQLQLFVNNSPIAPFANCENSGCLWTQNNAIWNSGSSTTAVLTVFNQSIASSGNDFAIDDISFIEIGSVVSDTIHVQKYAPSMSSGVNPAICQGSSATLTVQGASTYSWSPSTGLSTTTGDVVVASPTSTTIYTITGTSLNGCSGTATITVTVNQNPSIIVNNVSVCENGTVTLSATGASTYSWSPSQYLNANSGPNVIFSNGQTTTYTVTGTSVAGCVASEDVIVTVNPNPIVFAGNNEIVCDGDQLTLQASGANTYSWTVGITNGVGFTPTVTTTYIVTGTTTNGCSGTDDVLVTVNSLPSVFAGNDATLCAGDQLVLQATGADTYTWSGGIVNGIGFYPSSSTTYTVTGTFANGCSNTDQINVIVNSLPIVDFGSNINSGCAPLDVVFTNNSTNSVACVWALGDGANIVDCGSFVHTYNSDACFDVTLTVTSAEGCINSLTKSSMICVYETPVAGFDASSTIVETSDANVLFTNTSSGATNYFWDFGDETESSIEINPEHDYATADFGNYLVSLIASTPMGCSDTATTIIQVSEYLLFFIPNSFTPDGNNFNQTFKPIFTAGFDPFSYTLSIYNRWGELLYVSHDSNVGWDGSYGIDNAIKDIPEGVYTWKIEFKSSQNDEHKLFTGSVNLMR